MIRPSIRIELWPTTSPGNQSVFYSNQPRKPACYKVRLGEGHAAISTSNLSEQWPLQQWAPNSQNLINNWLAASLIFVPASNLDKLEWAKDIPLTNHIKCPTSRRAPTVSLYQQPSKRAGLKASFFPTLAFPPFCLRLRLCPNADGSGWRL